MIPSTHWKIHVPRVKQVLHCSCICRCWLCLVINLLLSLTAAAWLWQRWLGLRELLLRDRGRSQSWGRLRRWPQPWKSWCNNWFVGYCTTVVHLCESWLMRCSCWWLGNHDCCRRWWTGRLVYIRRVIRLLSRQILRGRYTRWHLVNRWCRRQTFLSLYPRWRFGPWFVLRSDSCL